MGIIIMISTFLLTNKPIISLNRRLLHGALAGGFSREALQQWSMQEWNDKHSPYSDLLSQKVSTASIDYLNEHPHPSSELAKFFFKSVPFAPERIILTPFRYQHSALPNIFTEGTKYLFWTVRVHTPLEIILRWQLNGIDGCTMIAYDPQIKRVYHGNSIHSSVTKNNVFRALTPLHVQYAKLLLSGMVQELESNIEK
mmetsp:Transcript_1918/g.2336  ORF Transcript_1918/g.2336 Transcript_1918/m.2336 type:complete len:198 (+) Transcript_1918:59-652(+)